MIIAIEGPDGAGKTTLARALADRLSAHLVALPSREVVPWLAPGHDATGSPLPDTPSAALARALSLPPPLARTLLLADCMRAVHEARERGGVTIMDRCALSTAVYQRWPEAIALSGELRPDRVIVLLPGVEVLVERLGARGETLDDFGLGWEYFILAQKAIRAKWAISRHESLTVDEAVRVVGR